MIVRLPDGNLVTVEPVLAGYHPDGGQFMYVIRNAAYHTWLRVNAGPWVLMARADYAALLIDVAKEAQTLDEYETYLKTYWHESVCDPGIVDPPRPVLAYGLDTWV